MRNAFENCPEHRTELLHDERVKNKTTSQHLESEDDPKIQNIRVLEKNEIFDVCI